MGALIDELQATRTQPLLWLDTHAYSAALFGVAPAVWLDCAASVSWQRRAQGLLRSDAYGVPLATICAAWLDAHAPLQAAMAAKSRLVFALKTMLADTALRAHLLELVQALRASFAGLPLLLVLPSPRAWTALAHARAQASPEPIVVADDDADSAAMYCADFLRTFADAGLDGLVLEETVATSPAAIADLACYQSVLNLATHYRWDVGLATPGRSIDLIGSGMHFAIAAAYAGVPTGIGLADDFWRDAATPAVSAPDFRYVPIPPAIAPERVLERVASLRVGA